MPLLAWAALSVAGLFGASSLWGQFNDTVNPPQTNGGGIFPTGTLVGLGLIGVAGVFLYRTLKGK